MTRPVAFNAETARDLAAMVTERRRQPAHRLPKRKPKEPENYHTIFVEPPDGGIASGSSAQCQVQLVDENGTLTNDDWQADVVNPYASTVGDGTAFILCTRVTNGYWVPISEDCA